LLYGPLSDRFGRKPPLYFGFVIYTVGALGCALSTSMTMLMAFRVVQAMGACSGMTIGRAIVRDRCQPEDAARAFSTLMSIISIAPILAPIAGGFIVGAAGWRAAFYFQGALGIAILIAMHIALQESLAKENRASIRLGSVLKTYLQLLKDRTFLGYSLIGGFAMASLFCYVSGAPTILPAMYAVAPETFGWLIGVNGIAFLTASRFNLRALRKQKPGAILARFVWVPPVFGFAIIAAGAFSNIIVTVPLLVVLVLQFGFFISTARVLPNVSALALASRTRDAGTASALLGALQSVTSMVTGASIAYLSDGTLVPLGIIMTTSVLTCVVIHKWMQH
jgi:DHA1 family bicyclomycin/chloramphenicol resistance-like MFS transporter